ncbi:hypothetical protein ACPPVT_21630 [Angustibacter sp. McL0619]|uniref:hypothetical protein n=1 Tax=Angustibacter sp. McL0619 TaxID=3415676 RepID=UPI003CFAF2DC
MRSNGAGLLALLCAAAVAVLPACSGDDGTQSLTARIQSTIPAFCVGADDDTKGTCFITTSADGVKESDLHAGECITVTYTPANGDESPHATNVARSQKC